MSADEAFIAGDRAGAKALYNEASDELRALESVTVQRAADVNLLLQDIDYRHRLLTRGFEFWGVLYSTRPLNPVAQLSNLRADVKALSDAVHRLQALKDQLAGNNLEALRGIARQEKASAEAGIQALEGQKAQISDEYHKGRQLDLHERIARVQALQEELAAKQKVALAELKAEQSSMNALLVQGIGSAIGVPAEVTAIANGQSIDQALVSAATRLAGDPEFVAAVGGMSDVAATISEAYVQGQQLVARAKETMDTVNQATELVRKPSLEGVMRLGAKVYAEADPATRAQIDGVVREAKAVVPLLELARSDAPLTDAVRGWLQERPELDKALMVGRLVDHNKAQFATWYGGTLKEILALNLNDQIAPVAFDQLLRAAPETLLDSLSADVQRRLLAQLNVANRAAALRLLRQRGAELLPIQMAGGRIRVDAAGLDVDLAQLGATLDPAALPAVSDVVRRKLESGLSQLATAENAVLGKLIAKTPAAELERLAGKILDADPSKAGALFDGVLARAPNQGAATLTKLAHVQAGVLTGQHKEILQTAPSDALAGAGKYPRPSQPSANQQAAGVDALKAALAGPLGAAFPHAKVAMMAAQWIGGNANMMSKIDGINDISAEIQRYVVEEMHLRDSVDEAEYRQQIALIEQGLADKRQTQALQEVQNRQDEVSAISDNVENLRQRIVAGYRINYIFYMAELVRFDFDALNRSLRTWTGAYGHTDLVRAKTLADPNQLRMALDPQVRLFDFLKDGDVERQRGDLEALSNSGVFMLKVAENVCRTYSLGCTKDNPKLGPVEFSPTFELTQLLPATELDEFRQWQARRAQNVPFRTTLFVHPAGVGHRGQLQQPARDRRVVRVVEVGLTALDPANQEREARVRLSHPGVAYIQGRAGYYLESLTPVSGIGTLPRINQLSTATQYEARWAQAGGHMMRAFEGYGLFTDWFIEILPEPENWNLKDLRLQFVYQYQPDTPASESHAYDMLVEGNGGPLFFDATQLVTLGPREQLEAKLAEWSKQSPGWRHGAVVKTKQDWMDSQPETVRRLRAWAR